MTNEKKYVIDNPALMAEWNWDKNTELRLHPESVTIGSGKKAWWRCDKGHEWESRISHKANGHGCPYCAGQKAIVGINDLGTTNPELILEWDWEKNGTLDPKMFMKKSNARVWWKCSLGHSWKATINHRTSGTSCPHCYSENQTSFAEQVVVFYLSKITNVENRKQIEGKEIDIFLPDYKIGIEYDGIKYHNSENRKRNDYAKDIFFSQKGIALYRIKESQLSMFDIHNRIIYCKPDREYKYLVQVLMFLQSILNITIEHVDIARDRIAIYNQYVQSIKANSIAVKYPYLIDEWDYELNGRLSPQNVTVGSSKKVYWRCLKCHSSYITSIAHKTSGTNCPYCSGKKVNQTNSLLSVFPELETQWDYPKNRPILPNNVYYGSRKVVFWKCQQCRESYKMAICAKIKAKTAKCPKCMHLHIGNRNRLIAIKKSGSLYDVNPPFLADWDYAKNLIITPKDVTMKSGIKVWWKCSKCGFEWESSICNRASGFGCSNCARVSSAKKRERPINVYHISNMQFYRRFESAKILCEHLGLDFKKQAGNISAICHRKAKSLQGKYVLRYVTDDEFVTE